jgi:hypothetical protein
LKTLKFSQEFETKFEKPTQYKCRVRVLLILFSTKNGKKCLVAMFLHCLGSENFLKDLMHRKVCEFFFCSCVKPLQRKSRKGPLNQRKPRLGLAPLF